MKIEYDTIKIQMSKEDASSFCEELYRLYNHAASAIAAVHHETRIEDIMVDYPTVLKLFQALRIAEQDSKMPF